MLVLAMPIQTTGINNQSFSVSLGSLQSLTFLMFRILFVLGFSSMKLGFWLVESSNVVYPATVLVSGHVLQSARETVALDKCAFLSAILLHPVLVHGTHKSLCICNGKSWAAKVIAVITVWLIERKNGNLLVMSLSSTMVNGPSSVSLGFRY